MRDIELMMDDYRLTTAEILYHMPDHPTLLQTYVWQDLDLAPRYPILSRFLTFWQCNLDGALHSVRLGQKEVLIPAQLIHADAELTIH